MRQIKSGFDVLLPAPGGSALSFAIIGAVCGRANRLQRGVKRLHTSRWWRWGRVELPVQTSLPKNVLQA
jgi:hypothetical protein